MIGTIIYFLTLKNKIKKFKEAALDGAIKYAIENPSKENLDAAIDISMKMKDKELKKKMDKINKK
ncbi:hypothetical protein R4J17_00205 [Brachyspira intermedia]|uniref:hypothetical protein n=1 Tax=Brachyspira intermedia TaxID=84377 RepID=UPI003003D6AF